MVQLAGAASDVLLISPSTGGLSFSFRQHFHSVPHSKYLCSSLFFKRCPSFCIPKLGNGMDKCRMRDLTVRASGSSDRNVVPIAPLQFESPVGQLLAQILQTHPHLLPAAIDQQLENIQIDKNVQREDTSQDLLYQRIAEVKEKERQKAVEEIIYCLIVQKFVENDISMIPKIETSDPVGRVDFWPNQEQKLESVHSPEAFEMIQSHLSLVLGERLVGPLDTIIQISKIKLGKLYAASIMYGYFLRRVDQRFQLERTMKTLPEGFDEDKVRYEEREPSPMNRLWDPDSLIRIPPNDDGTVGESFMDGGEGKSYRLRSYVMYLDAETLQRYATIRSKEAISLIEKQTQALFGRPDVRVLEDGSIDTSKDEVISVTFLGLTMLVLEAVAFGSFMWDSESYVESKYPFIKS